MTEDRHPVTTVEDLESLDDGEVVEGYHDGLEDAPKPGANRTRAYWHGWRNGMVDGGYMEKDWAQATLAHNYLKAQSND